MHPTHVIQQMVSCKLAEEKLRRKDKTPLLLAQTSALTLSLPAIRGVRASLAVVELIIVVLKVFALDIAEAF